MCSVIRFSTHSVMGTNVTTHFWQLLLRLRGFIIVSLSFSSLYLHLQDFLFPFFLIAHHTIVTNKCSIRWFNNYSWKSLLRGLLSSVLKHQQHKCYCSGHTRFHAWRSGGFWKTKLSTNTNLQLKQKLSMNDVSPNCAKRVLPDALLSVRSSVVSSSLTLCSKRLILGAMSVM